MKIVFLSNFMSTHQLPFLACIYGQLGDTFHFIETEENGEAGLYQGTFEQDHQHSFVIRAYESEEQRRKAQQLTDAADVVILGSAPREYLRSRLREGKLTFLYSERIYKSGYEAWKLPVRLIRRWRTHGRHRSLYLLCASAYTAGDFAKTFTFLNKAYKWGYFPQTYRYENPELVLEKKKPASILWAARFIGLKHPEYVLEVARRLKAENYSFHIQMMGNGPLWEPIARQIREQDLEAQIELLGAVPAEGVRPYMEAASIFLFTSDRNEGWGAVMNESMNSGCAVVADQAIGSVPFLLKNGENGLTYSGSVDELYEKVKYLLDHPRSCREMGRRAYETITEEWNAETAAERLLSLCEVLLRGGRAPTLYESGPCSKAEILKD